MIPILPPELIDTILESTIFLHHDLTRIALTSRARLPFARKLLYRSIQVYFNKGVGYVLLVPGQSMPVAWVHRQAHGGQATAKENSAVFAKLLSNPILSPLVKTFRIHAEIGATQANNTAHSVLLFAACQTSNS